MTPEFREQLQWLYAELDQELAYLGVTCWVSGRCCRFQEFGHTLFLCDQEAALLFEESPPSPVLVDPNHCPYQVGNLCTARHRRPLGCRVFFCDPTYQGPLQEIAERYVCKLKQLVAQAGLPWRYAPLIEHLKERFSTAESQERT